MRPKARHLDADMRARVLQPLALESLELRSPSEFEVSEETAEEPGEGEDPEEVLFKDGATAEDILRGAWDGSDVCDDFPVFCDATASQYFATGGCAALHYPPS